MSDSEVESVHVEPLPNYRVKFTDMPKNLEESVARICEKANALHKLDKMVSTEIQKKIQEDEQLDDKKAGWHVIVGHHFAAAITYKTKFVCFLELLDGCPKSFLLFKTE